MNSSMVRFILGHVLTIEAYLLILPCVVAMVYGESQGMVYFGVAILCFCLGHTMTFKKPGSTVFYLKEGCVATALSWIILSIFGCLPFYITGEIPSFVDALFETISGFTTTGASVLSDVECLTHCSLFWRSFTHWIGGMGVLVFLLAILPLSGGSHINLMRAESPGPSVGKLVPKVHQTARILYIIYIGLTVLEFLFLVLGQMPVFDAICTSFGTAGTGGFGIHNDSIAGYSVYHQWVITVFMILFGVNFNAFYLLLFDNARKAFKMEEVKAYFVIITSAIVIIMINTANVMGHFWDNLRNTAFQVASIITTTGFSTVDFDTWSQTSRTIIVLLMFVGACAGSTGGGIKVSRFCILYKTIKKEVNSYLHPKSVKKLKMDDKPIDHDVVRSINVYIVTFLFLFILSVLILSADGHSLTTNFTAVAATINNIGPGLEMVGPTQNFGFFSDLSKFVLMFDMLAGRLELFPLLILFYPPIWKEVVKQALK